MGREEEQPLPGGWLIHLLAVIYSVPTLKVQATWTIKEISLSSLECLLLEANTMSKTELL